MNNKKTSINLEGQGLIVDTSKYKGSQYSQVVGVTVTEIDTTLEFVYINPIIKNKGEVVSRITLPTSVAHSLAEKISSTILLNEQKIAKKS